MSSRLRLTTADTAEHERRGTAELNIIQASVQSLCTAVSAVVNSNFLKAQFQIDSLPTSCLLDMRDGAMPQSLHQTTIHKVNDPREESV